MTDVHEDTNGGGRLYLPVEKEAMKRLSGNQWEWFVELRESKRGDFRSTAPLVWQSEGREAFRIGQRRRFQGTVEEFTDTFLVKP